MPVQLHQERNRTEFGEQLPAMLKTSGNWLRRCGEICAAFFFPDSFLLTDTEGSFGQENEEIGRSLSLYFLTTATPAISQCWLLAGIFFSCCFHICCQLYSGGTTVSEYFSSSISVQPPNHTLLNLIYYWSLHSKSDSHEVLNSCYCVSERERERNIQDCEIVAADLNGFQKCLDPHRFQSRYLMYARPAQIRAIACWVRAWFSSRKAGLPV